MTTNLETTAKNMISDLIGDRVDIDALRDAISDRAHEEADNACIYYHHCEDIISRYESDPRADTASADDMGQTFKPSEYQQAMQAYAFWIARSIIEAEASTLVDELEEASEALITILNDSTRQHMPVDGMTDTDRLRLSADCPHGWAAHNYEDNDGACFWVSRQLDGCNAVAIPVAGVWLSYTWE